MSTSTPQTLLADAQTKLGEIENAAKNAAKVMSNKGGKTSLANIEAWAPEAVTDITDALTIINTPPIPPPPASPQPNGPTGSWNLVNDFEFPGTTLPSEWASHTNWTGQNGVTDLDSNIAVANGSVGVTCSDAQYGAAIQTVDAVVKRGYCYSFHALFPAVNWNAVWASTLDAVPSSEYIEFDNAEFLNNILSCTTHDANGASVSTYPPGTWTAAYHDFTVWRNNGTALYFWDGTLVKTSAYAESGAPMFLIITAGNGQNDTFRAGAQLLVASAKVWSPA